MSTNHTILFRPLKKLYLCKDEFIGVYGDAFMPPFETNVEPGKHDYKTCELCQKNYNKLLENATKIFDQFPLCCENHANLLKVNGFDKKLLADAPKFGASKIIYTQQHIINNIDRNDWYTDITDYLDYTLFSFGMFPENCGNPFMLSTYEGEIRGFLERNRKIFGDKKVQKLINFIDDYFLPESAKQTDIELLLEYYKKWLIAFPFEISFFSSLKSKYEKTIPILREKPHYNPYLNATRAMLHNKDSLIETLLSLTNNLLVNINSLRLYENGLLTDAQKVKIELSIAKRNAQLNDSYIKKGKSPEQAYRKMLKEWYQDEIDFLDNIKDTFKQKPGRPQMENLPEKLEDIFVKPEFCEPCLDILKHLDPPVLDAENRYIGKLKGVIPLWVKTLKNYKGKSIIKNCPDSIYAKVLNDAIPGLNLTKDASEFRKIYSRLINTEYQMDIKTKLSQLSQMGKLGK